MNVGYSRLPFRHMGVKFLTCHLNILNQVTHDGEYILIIFRPKRSKPPEDVSYKRFVKSLSKLFCVLKYVEIKMEIGRF